MVGQLFEQADLLSSQFTADVKFQIGCDAEAKPFFSSGASGHPLVAGERLQVLQQQFFVRSQGSLVKAFGLKSGSIG